MLGITLKALKVWRLRMGAALLVAEVAVEDEVTGERA